MLLIPAISPHGHILLAPAAADDAGELALSPDLAARLQPLLTGDDSTSCILAHLATKELTTPLPPSLAFLRDFAKRYLTRLCHTPGLADAAALPPITPPAAEELHFLPMQAPPITGSEFLTADLLSHWWQQLDAYLRNQIQHTPGGTSAWLRTHNPLWHLVGRVTFHLAENKRDDTHPFAFLATYATRLSAQGKTQHLPLSRALQEYADAKDRASLLSLLLPIQTAGQHLPWVQQLIDSRQIYQPLAWTPKEAYRFLQDITPLESAGLIVRVPDWWKAKNPARPQVQVKIGEAAHSRVGADALLDFHVSVALEGDPLTPEELRTLLAANGNLIRLRGQWVQLDKDKLSQALDHWKSVEKEVKTGGITFFDGMRLLAGASLTDTDLAPPLADPERQWTHVLAGDWLDRTLTKLRDPESAAPPKNLHATLRPYQQTGLAWLQFMTSLKLGACLADDMGLGKTIQIIALLLQLKNQPAAASNPPSLLVVPASLIANWQAELTRFAPSLVCVIAHPSESDIPLDDPTALAAALKPADLAITTYGMLARLDALRKHPWRLVILDEAQAIKNAGARQSKAVKDLTATSRIALTGTPIENRLSDLWSLFDFLNPGLLGGPKTFATFVKRLKQGDSPDYTPLRTLIQPYILRRLKTDRRIISDLPDKTEINAFCGLTKLQASLYQNAVDDLSSQLHSADGIKRQGVILAALMRFKQICNHPAQWQSSPDYTPEHSGKFQRLADLCAELADRQQKALIFTQFREITQPLADFLATLFRAPGLVLHGSTPLKQRRAMVDAFQRDDGPPFFVLSLKAGGTGLNLTAASHVIHFDRWWNPAVENQATDRAFRIGQKKNVVVHKFVCRGTVEEKIDQMIADKSALSSQLLEEGPEKRLTELSNDDLLRFVSLDIHKATAEQ